MVLLPEPLGPRKPKTSPRATCQVDPAHGLDFAVVLHEAVDRDDRIRGVHHASASVAMRLASSDCNASRRRRGSEDGQVIARLENHVAARHDDLFPAHDRDEHAVSWPRGLRNGLSGEDRGRTDLRFEQSCRSSRPCSPGGRLRPGLPGMPPPRRGWTGCRPGGHWPRPGPTTGGRRREPRGHRRGSRPPRRRFRRGRGRRPCAAWSAAMRVARSTLPRSEPPLSTTGAPGTPVDSSRVRAAATV